MRVLDISVDIGPGARMSRLELLTRGVRVSGDVVIAAEMKRIRRVAQDQMRFPTDDELRAALDRLPAGSETSPRYRAQIQIDARQQLRREIRNFPPDFWLDWYYRRGPLSSDKDRFGLREAGFERMMATLPVPFVAGAIGLDALDPVLYQALVADVIAASMPEEAIVRQLRYENPFFVRLLGRRGAEQTITGTAQLIETVATVRSTRKMARDDATVSESTVTHRIEESEVNLEMKKVQLAREREALRADRIANEHAASQLRIQLSIVEVLQRGGFLDAADSVGELDEADAAALGQLALNGPVVEERWEPDEDDIEGS